MGKPVHVVILAGGYSPEITRGAAAAAAEATAIVASATSLTPPPLKPGAGGGGGALAAVTAAGPGTPAVPALLPLDGVPAVVRLLRSLKTVKRVNLEAVWVVHNESDTAALRGPGGLFGASPASDLGLPAVNFLSNGATGPGSWRGEGADLLAAVAAIGAADAYVAAISGALAYMPNYNLQRLLEHSYLRGRDVIGSSFLNGVDLMLLGEGGFVAVVPGDDTALPRVERLERLRGAANEGDKVAEPFLFLRPETLSSLAALAASGPGLIDLAAGLLAGGTYVAAVDLTFGRYNLRTARAVDYADKFFAFCSAAAIDPIALGLKPDVVVQPYDTTPGGSKPNTLPPQPAAGSFIGRSTAADFRFDEFDRLTGGGGTASAYPSPAESLYGSDYEAFLRSAAAFNERFFGDIASGRRGRAPAPGMKPYLLPSTFYMTAYRRQGADIMF